MNFFSKSKNNQRDNEVKNIEELIAVKGIKAIGNQLSSYKIKNINQLEPIEYNPPEKPTVDELELKSEEIIEDTIDNTSNDGQTELDFN